MNDVVVVDARDVALHVVANFDVVAWEEAIAGLVVGELVPFVDGAGSGGGIGRGRVDAGADGHEGDGGRRHWRWWF